MGPLRERSACVWGLRTCIAVRDQTFQQLDLGTRPDLRIPQTRRRAGHVTRSSSQRSDEDNSVQSDFPSPRRRGAGGVRTATASPYISQVRSREVAEGDEHEEQRIPSLPKIRLEEAPYQKERSAWACEQDAEELT